MPIRAGSLTLKMTPSFIRAHGTGLPAALALSGGFQQDIAYWRRAGKVIAEAAAKMALFWRAKRKE